MKKISTICTLLLVLTLISTHSNSAAQKRVAILDILITDNAITDAEADYLTDLTRDITREALPLYRYLIMTKENIESLLSPEQMEQLKRCTSDTCEVEAGRMVEADYVVTGVVLKFGTGLRLTLKIHDTKSANLLKVVRASGKSVDALEFPLEEKARELFVPLLEQDREQEFKERALPKGTPKFITPESRAGELDAGGVVEIKPTERPKVMSGPAGIYITTKPEGADVYFGDTKVGNTDRPFQNVDLVAGTRLRITLRKELYHDKIFYVDLKPGVPKYEAIKLEPAFGELEVTSEPSGATLYLNGKAVGKTPFREPRMSSGEYNLVLDLPECHKIEDQVVVVEDEKATSKHYLIKPAFGSIEIHSDPSGAKVSIAGKQVGVTPYVKKMVPSDRYLISLDLDLYDPVSSEVIEVRDGERTKKVYKLEANFGTLDIDSSPTEATVQVNGVKRGITPVTLKMSPGKYRIALTMDGYHCREYEIAVIRGGGWTIGADKAILVEKVGSILVVCEPSEPGAQVFLDGKKLGEAPLTINDISIGDHNVEIKTQRKYGRKKVEIIEAEFRTVSIPLKEKIERVLNKLGIEMIRIPAGRFMMGSPKNEKWRSKDEFQHEVVLSKPFLAGKYEVTVSQYRTFLEGKGFSLNEADMNFNLAIISLLNGELEKTIHHLEEVHRIFPDDAENLFNLGVVYSRNKQFDKSLICYKEAQRMDPKLTRSEFVLIMQSAQREGFFVPYRWNNGWEKVDVDDPHWMAYWQLALSDDKNIPIFNISWFDAIEFCNWLSEEEELRPAYQIVNQKVIWDRNSNGYRLPTEAEWEYACRAGTSTSFYTGGIKTKRCKNDPSLDLSGWYCWNSGDMLHLVGKKKPNDWGFHDMHGNVWEWCWDWHGTYQTNTITDQTGPEEGMERVVRGGSFRAEARQCRSAKRFSLSPNSRNSDIGFRIFRSLSEDE